MQSFQKNSAKSNDEIYRYGGYNFFGENFWPPITRKRYELGPPNFGLSSKTSSVYDILLRKRQKKCGEKNFFFENFFLRTPIFPPTHDPKEL
jgi:hypothetical protein